MSISLTEILNEQPTNSTARKAGIGGQTKTHIDLSLSDNSVGEDELQQHESASQSLSFSDHLSKIQQSGKQLIATTGNKLPVSSNIHESLQSENTSITAAEGISITDLNNIDLTQPLNSVVEGVSVTDVDNIDLAQQSTSVAAMQIDSSVRETNNNSEATSVNGKKSIASDTALTLTNDRVYESNPFGQTLINDSDSIRLPVVANGVGNNQNDVSIPIVGNLNDQISSRRGAFEPAVVVTSPLVEEKSDLAKSQSTQVRGVVNNTVVPQSLSFSDASEQTLNLSKLSATKDPIASDQILADKLEPKVKFVDQEIKATASNVALTSANGKTLNQLSSVLIPNQDTSQPPLVQNINNTSLTVQNIAVQSLPNAPIDQNTNGLLQQGLSLRQDFSPNLANRIQWIYQQALASAEILMDPPELGPLSVKLHTSRGETNILFQVSNPQTKDMIEENLAKLKESLEQLGIQLGDTQVDHKEANSETEDGFGRSNSLANDEVEHSQGSDSSVQTIGLLDIYA